MLDSRVPRYLGLYIGAPRGLTVSPFHSHSRATETSFAYGERETLNVRNLKYKLLDYPLQVAL